MDWGNDVLWVILAEIELPHKVLWTDFSNDLLHTGMFRELARFGDATSHA